VSEQVDSTRAGAVRRDRQRRSRSARLFARDILLIFLAALLISFLVKTFLIRSFYIPSESMEDTLQLNDRIIVNQLVPDLTPISRGDVVVFRDPGGWLTPAVDQQQNWFAETVDSVLGFVGLTAPDSNDHLIKRVIGLPGDTVECCNEFGQLIVNGVPIDEAAYIKLPENAQQVTPETFEVKVPDESLWMMGDNRFSSADSAAHRGDPGEGFVPVDNVVGRAVVVSWPVTRWQWLDDYPFVFREVENAAEDAESAPPGEEPADDTGSEGNGQ
jgi:signal peptidase I